MDPKVKKLLIFFVLRGGALLVLGYGIGYGAPYLGFRDPCHIFVLVLALIVGWRALLSIYRRAILPAKQPSQYGKWVIVTGSTSGIGKAFIEHLASLNMNVLAISRSEEKLKEQVTDLASKYGVSAEFLAFDFLKSGEEGERFYKDLHTVCAQKDKDGGIGMLINNVGFNVDPPMNLDEFSDQMIQDMIQCNIFSVVNMTRTVLKYMKERKNGCVVTVSSGSGNHPTPMLTIYSSTKAFITQFSRSMSVECWGTGVDFLVVTPYYIVSNLFKRKSGTILAPMPDALVKGALAQVGKKYIWQGHGYWFHGLLGNIAAYYWGTMDRWKFIMTQNRERYDARMAREAAAALSGSEGSKKDN